MDWVVIELVHKYSDIFNFDEELIKRRILISVIESEARTAAKYIMVD